MEDQNVTTAAAPEVSDNSSAEADLGTQISNALDEPDNGSADTETEDNEQTDTPSEPKTEDVKDNISQCPDKFKNKDGSVDVDNLSKSYVELEKLRSAEQTKWQQEKAELLKAKEQLDKLNQLKEDNAKNAGFNSAEEMSQVFEMASLEANEYSKYLQYLDNDVRDDVRNLLIQYANTPTPELMAQIELEFAPEVNKHVAIQADRMRQSFAARRKQEAETRKMANIESVISQSVDSNPEVFKYEPFKKLFVDTLHKYGDSFTFEDAKVLMETMTCMKNAYQEEFAKKTGVKIANDQATDKLAGLGDTSSAPASGQVVDFNSLSKAELDKYIRKYI